MLSMIYDLLDYAVLLLTPAVPAWAIFVWPTGGAAPASRRKLRHAVGSYSLSLIIASSLGYGLASAARAKPAALAGTIAMQRPLDAP